MSQVPGLSSEKTAMLCVVVAHWRQVVPFVILVVSAGLTSIPADVYEAAYLDGASGNQAVFQK
ncbi:MAG: ABC transporter permease subunit [Oscillospiraceae bacterium]